MSNIDNSSIVDTIVAYDGVTFGVFESSNADKELEVMCENNIHLEILSEGNHLTRHQVELMFMNNIIRRTNKITWFILNSIEAQLMIDAVADGVELGNINLERND